MGKQQIPSLISSLPNIVRAGLHSDDRMDSFLRLRQNCSGFIDACFRPIQEKMSKVPTFTLNHLTSLLQHTTSLENFDRLQRGKVFHHTLLQG